MRTACVPRWPIGSAEIPEQERIRRTSRTNFVRFMRRHARFEEHEILPIARAAFMEAEWRAVERAFVATADPLIESQSRRQCEAALRRMGGVQAA